MLLNILLPVPLVPALVLELPPPVRILIIDAKGLFDAVVPEVPVPEVVVPPPELTPGIVLP